MSTEQTTVETDEAPRTRVCRTCSVEINAASARCPYCGARQFKHQPILGWRGALVCLIAVAVAVLVTRAVIDAANGGLRYEPYRSADLAALVPAGYTDQLLAAPHGTAIASFVDASVPDDSETIRATAPAHGTLHSRAVALAASLHKQPGVAESSLGPVADTLAGGETAWEVLYTLAGADYAVFELDACGQRVAVTVTLSANRLSVLDDLSEVLPQSAEPICDGPDFSDRDRADISVPLRTSA